MSSHILTRTAWGSLIFLIYLFLLAPIIVVLIISFDTRPYLAFPPESLSVRSYVQVLQNATFVRAFGVSFVVGLVVAALALLAGTLASLALVRRRFRLREGAAFTFILPLLVPHIVLAVGVLLVLAVFDLIDTYTGIILAHVGITIPYVIRTVSMSLEAVDVRVEEAARVHGAAPFTAFRRITLPLIMPGVISGAVVAFLISFDEAVISLFIVNTRVRTLPVAIYNYLEFRTDPQVAALSVILILISVMLVVVLERVIGLRRVLR